jgi:hypothetical protein
MDEAHRLGIVVAGHKPVRVSFLEQLSRVRGDNPDGCDRNETPLPE